MTDTLPNPVDGSWKRLAERLAVCLRQGIHIAESYKADYPDSDVILRCKEFAIEAEAALKDD